MSETEFTAFLQTVCARMATHSADGALHYVFMDWRHLHEITTAARAVYAETLNLCAWVKTNGGMGSMYRSQHEFVLVFKVGQAAHINNVQLGRFGRNRTNVWNYAGANAFGAERDAMLAAHPTVKPVQLVADALLDASHRGGLVLDPFGGSGTTAIAAERTRRRARLMELDPIYCDVIIRRYEAFTGDHAVHAESRRAFADIADQAATKMLSTPRRRLRSADDSSAASVRRAGV